MTQLIWRESMSGKYQMTLTREQIMLIANCVEDCHRFACGQTELWHTSSQIDSKNRAKLRTQLQNLQPLITPELAFRASYDWAGNGCKDLFQRKFIAQTYAIYREILHKVVNNGVYAYPTLTCEEGGKLPIIEEVEE